MNNNSNACLLIKFAPQSELSLEAVNFLDSWFEVSALNYTEDGLEEYVGYVRLDFDISQFEKNAKKNAIKLPSFTVERLDSANWLAENVIKYAPIETSGICIYGAHETQPPKTNKLTLKIYAATAFGSGHQTTRCCLEALQRLRETQATPQKILDMGTGSGILSLACAKMWQKNKPQITAVDIDDEAVRVTTQNAFDNQLESYLSVAQSDGYNCEIVQNNAPYDLILANILARPLIEMAPELSQHLQPGGYCILSGFVTDQVDWVVSAHINQGLQIIETYAIDNWHAVLMRK